MEKHEKMMGKKKKIAQLRATINYGTQVRFHFGIVRMSLTDISLLAIPTAASEKYWIWRYNLSNTTNYLYDTEEAYFQALGV